MRHELDELSLFDCSNQTIPFKCKTCPNFQTNFSTFLRHHSISGHNEENLAEKTYECLQCPFVTSSVYLHLQHGFFSECAKNNKKKQFVGYGDGMEITLKEAPTKDTSLSKSGQSILRSSHFKSGTWNCDQCPFSTKHKKSLKKHIIYRHSKPEDIQWFNCDQCPSRFKEVSNLNKHIISRHSNPEDIHWLYCDQCPLKFKRKQDLKTHTTSCHTKSEDIRWFKCDHCPYKCKRNSDLKRHTGCCHSKPEDVQFFKCEHCLSIFKHKSSLKSHVSSKHS